MSVASSARRFPTELLDAIRTHDRASLSPPEPPSRPTIDEQSERYDACRALQAAGVRCTLWFEDADRYHGVPTVLFDIYILVDDMDAAERVLTQVGWQPTTINQGKVGSAVLSSPVVRLVPPGVDPIPPPKPPPLEGNGSVFYRLPTTVALLPAHVWSYDLTTHPPDSLFPRLPALLDAMIDTTLTDSDEMGHERWAIGIHIAYLYHYVREIRDPAFVQSLRFDNRQFHNDICAGMMVGTVPVAAHGRRVREEIRRGERQMIEQCSDWEDPRLFFLIVHNRTSLSNADG
ncbi:uncharacterized protein LOC62_02G003110 [Vanrija pseudolonga]|uniref:Uncharacterized protein n=1 Tax=Vanrija pseudolonga TaxID=143232 RepID=A0AAF0Y3T5_9TREE|nr:hypothetical protein LOC62_02G003110 [Vanrija pseudolonga]